RGIDLDTMAAAGTGPTDAHPAAPVLQATGVRKRFKDTDAVGGIDLVVHPGERVGLLGPNGAGKTTTLLMLLGALTPHQGELPVMHQRFPRHRSQAMEGVAFLPAYLPLPHPLQLTH